MPHITVQSLAKGIQGTLSSKEKAAIREDLIEGSTTLAVEVACEIIQDRTGLAKTVCRPVARQIVKLTRMAIKERMGR